MPTASRVTSSSRSKTLLRIMLCSGLAIGAFYFLSAGIKVSAVSDVLAAWSFEGVTTTNTGTTPIVSVGSPAADSGVQTAGSSFTGLHASSSTVWSNPAGNASAKSVSSNNWGVGDYYQFSFSTTGYTAISITWDQTGSGTGPRDFKVQYSTNGTSFTDAAGTNSSYSLTNPAIAWSATGSPNLASRRQNRRPSPIEPSDSEQ